LNKSKADAVAKAILEPHLRAQDARGEQLRARRAAEAALQRRKRRYAWFVLAGVCVGAGLAHFSGFRLMQGFILGGLAGAAIGWLPARRTA